MHDRRKLVDGVGLQDHLAHAERTSGGHVVCADVAARDDDRQVGTDRQHLARDVEPADAWHVEIRDDEIEILGPLPDERKRAPGVELTRAPKAGPLERAFYEAGTPELLNNFGVTLAALDRMPEATSLFGDALRLFPAYRDASANLLSERPSRLTLLPLRTEPFRSEYE